jgi:hypothetical protein
MLTPRVDDNQRRALWWSLAWPNLRDGLAITALLLITLVGLVFAFWNVFHTREDVRGAVPIEAEGVITALGYHPVDESNPNPHRIALLLVDGKTLLPNPEAAGTFRVLNPPLTNGARVRYTYRVGKSGRWYATQIERVPPSRD